MKLRRVDGARHFTLGIGWFGTFDALDGVIEVPDDLPASVFVTGEFEIVPEPFGKSSAPKSKRGAPAGSAGEAE